MGHRTPLAVLCAMLMIVPAATVATGQPSPGCEPAPGVDRCELQDAAEDAVADNDDASPLIPWTSWNDGDGSGLDADSLDGKDSSQFVRSDESGLIDGRLGVKGQLTIRDEGQAVQSGMLNVVADDPNPWLARFANDRANQVWQMFVRGDGKMSWNAVGGSKLNFEPDGDLRAWGDVFAHRHNHIGDLAEPVEGDGLEPGMVAVSDGFSDEGKLTVAPATGARDSSVIGIVSTDPSMQLAGLETDTPLAVTGIVPVKVTGEIAKDDLLTSSDVPGHATACEDPDACFGAVIGKALEGHAGTGTGEVRAMVTLG